MVDLTGGLLVPRKGCPHVGRVCDSRVSGAGCARAVTELGRPVAHVAAEIGVGEPFPVADGGELRPGVGGACHDFRVG